MEDLAPFESEPVEEIGGRRAGKGPIEWASDVLEAYTLLADPQGEVYDYDGARWRAMTPLQLARAIRVTIGGPAARGHVRNEIAGEIKLRVLEDEIEWRQLADAEIACQDGVVDVLTGERRAHRAEDYLESVPPHAYDPGAPCPAWEETLVQWFGDLEDDRVTALQEFFGYTLLPHAKFKKALLCYGPGDSGKSVVLWLLQELVGKGNWCSLSLEEMHDPVARVILRGAQLNVAGEVAGRELLRDAGFKRLVSTEEPVLINKKYVDPYNYVPVAKHAFACNQLPRIGAHAEEIFSRFSIVRFDRVFSREAADVTVPARLAAEMAGIFAWAVRGAAALIQNRGLFTETTATAKVLEDWRREEDPLRDWLRENLVENPGWREPFSHIAREASKDLPRRVSTKRVGEVVRALGLPHSDSAKVSGRSVACVEGMQIQTPEGHRPVGAEGWKDTETIT